MGTRYSSPLGTQLAETYSAKTKNGGQLPNGGQPAGGMSPTVWGPWAGSTLPYSSRQEMMRAWVPWELPGSTTRMRKCLRGTGLLTKAAGE